MNRRTVELVRFENAAGEPLDGALYLPEGRTRAAAVLVHGKGGNFYSGPSCALPPHLAAGGVATLACNMVCHDLAYSRPDDGGAAPGTPPQANGGMWERISEGHHDLAAAASSLLGAVGDLPLVVIGHSSGGFYAVQYLAHHPEPAAVVLLSPLTGNRTAFRWWFSSPAEEDELLAEARRLVAAGEGHRLLPLPSWYYAISASSLVERAAEDGSGFDASLSRMRGALCIGWGSTEDRVPLWRSALERSGASSKHSFELLGAAHDYVGFETELGSEVVGFLSEALPS